MERHRQTFNQVMSHFKYSAKRVSEWSGIEPTKLSKFRRGRRDLEAGEFLSLISSLPYEAQKYFWENFLGENLPTVEDFAKLRVKKILTEIAQQLTTEKVLSATGNLSEVVPKSWWSTVPQDSFLNSGGFVSLSFKARTRLANLLKVAAQLQGLTPDQFASLCRPGDKDFLAFYRNLLIPNQDLEFNLDELLPFLPYLPEVTTWRSDSPVITQGVYKGTTSDLIRLLESDGLKSLSI